VAEGSGLLNRQRVKLLVGSNPTSSANTKTQTKQRLYLGFVVFAEDVGFEDLLRQIRLKGEYVQKVY